MVVGAGFGKSTLLAQAMAENQLDPHGVDVWVGCTPDDAVAAQLAGRLLAALPVDPDGRRAAATVASICEQVRRLAPAEVAFILDDVQVLPPGSSGARLLEDLLRALPVNAHLVLAGRREPPVAWARLAAAGQVGELREADLSFTEEELTQFARLRGVPRPLLLGVAGWPALAELAATAGQARVTDYLWQEVLTQLPRRTRQLLAALAAMGGADDEVASALAGRPVVLDSLLAGLPLVSRSDGGWHRLHPLWHRAMARELDQAEVGQARRTAAQVLSRRGDVTAAGWLWADAGAWDDLDRLAVNSCQAAQVTVDGEVLGEWLRRLPPEHRDRPAGWLLEGILLRATDPRAAQAMLLRAGEAYQAAGDPQGVTACASHAAVTAWWQRDGETITRTLPRLVTLATASAEGRGRDCLAALTSFLRLVQADVRGDVPDDIAAAIVALDCDAVSRFPAEWQVLFDLGRGLAHLATGDPGRALWSAERGTAEALPPDGRGAAAITLVSLHLLGRQEDVLRLLPGMFPKPSRTSENWVVAHTLAASVTAWAGQPEQATAHLRRAEDLSAGLSAPLIELLLTAARLAVALVTDEENAVPLARHLDELRRCPPNGKGTAGRGAAALIVDQWFLAVQYVLLPSTRPWWDGQPLQGCFAVARDLAQAVMALRRGEPVDRSHLPEPGVMRAFLPPGWVAELVAPGGGTTTSAMSGAPAMFGAPAMSGAPATFGGAGAAATPQVPLHLRLLGPVRLLRGEAAVTDPRLRRQRVRELLAYLVIHRTIPRERIAADMWPDREPLAAARNLRVTLTYLTQLLQPDQPDGQPSALLRRTRHCIELIESPLLTTDVWTMDRLLDKAAHAERQHAPSVALACYQEALGHHGGSLFTESSSPDWLLPHRERLQRRVVAAAVRAGELLLADGAIDEPLRLAQQALTVDWWSEPAHQLLISVHVIVGNRTGARLALQECHHMLDGLGTAADPRTEMLARRVQGEPSRAMTSPPPRPSGPAHRRHRGNTTPR
jgi:LuxR family maltose regulon positive regulatory protein